MQGKIRAGNINRNGKNHEDGSEKIQRRQRDTDEREKLNKCSSVAYLKSVAETNEEGIQLDTRGTRQVT
jgi:hypothetical protein